MRIAADSNIPLIDTALAGLGDLRQFDSRNIAEVKTALLGADVLLCRSTIRVDEDLLRDSNVRFVATATSGTDHIDIPALQARGITVASAAGSNARSVAEWLAAALLRLYTEEIVTFELSTIGIVGIGHVGREVYRISDALGMEVVLNDPPRELRGEKPIPGVNVRFSNFEQALDCDIVTMHVPLTMNGPFATYHMMDMAQFNKLGDGGIFINSARGDVMARDACLLYADNANTVVLDVFPNEPNIDTEFLRQADIATPHIAGHSYDGKLLGTQMVYDALFEWMGRVPRWRHEAHLPELPIVQPRPVSSFSPYAEVADVVQQVYDIFEDMSSLYGIVAVEDSQRGAYFEKLRAEYPVRREFHRVTVKSSGLSREAREILGELGFRLIP